VVENDERVVVGFDKADDAAVVRLDGDRYILQTVDFFTPIVDDPYMYGQIAAANSISDIYAMGGTPLFALNILGFPINDLPIEILSKILQGGADKAKEAGVSIIGGHSIDDKEPKYGLVVTGEVSQDQLVKNSGAEPGDAILLTKPLGTGIITTGIKKEQASAESISAAVDSMALLNKLAGSMLNEHSVHAATDVTGFGLLGHAAELCRNSNVAMQINYSDLKFLPGTKQLAQQDNIPGGTKRNLSYASQFTHFAESITELHQLMIADSQTSGGLLIALPQERADKFLINYNDKASISAFQIGKVTERSETLITVS
jgi:selenide,water dikinase